MSKKGDNSSTDGETTSNNQYNIPNRGWKVPWDVFVEFFSKHPYVMKPGGRISKDTYKQLWNELTELLNAAAHTPRSVERWQKAWCDFKFLLKKKVRNIKDPELLKFKLSDNEKKILEILRETDYVYNYKAGLNDDKVVEHVLRFDYIDCNDISKSSEKRPFDLESNNEEHASCSNKRPKIEIEFNDVEDSNQYEEDEMIEQENSKQSDDVIRLEKKLWHTPWEVFMDYFEKHPELIKPLTCSALTREEYKLGWKELSENLNAFARIKRTPERWFKAWTDFKFVLKRKINRYDNPDELDKNLASHEKTLLKMLRESNIDEFSNSTFENDQEHNNERLLPIEDFFVISSETSTPTRPNDSFDPTFTGDIKQELDIENDMLQPANIITVEMINALKDIHESINSRLSAVERSVSDIRHSIDNLTAAIAPSLRTLANAAMLSCNKK